MHRANLNIVCLRRQRENREASVQAAYTEIYGVWHTGYMDKFAAELEEWIGGRGTIGFAGMRKWEAKERCRGLRSTAERK